MALLEIRNLSVEFATAQGRLRAVDGIDLVVEEGEILGIVGESGSGKSVAMLAAMGLAGANSHVRADRMRFGDADLLALAPRERRRLVGKDMAMVFQEPTASLNPCFTIGCRSARRCACMSGWADGSAATGWSSCCARSGSRRRRCGSAPFRTSSPAA